MDSEPSTSTGGFTRGSGETRFLEGLGEVYDQTELEDDIIGEIDDQIRSRERLDKDKQLQDVAGELKQTKLRIKTIDDYLAKINDENSLSKDVRRNIQSIKKEKDNKEKQLRKLEAKLRSLRIFLGHEEVPDNNEEVDDETRLQLQMLLGDEETEADRRVKRGESTPFGKQVRELKLPENDMFDKFLDEEFGNSSKKQRREILRAETSKPRQSLMVSARATKRLAENGTDLNQLRPKKKGRCRDMPLGSTTEYAKPKNRLISLDQANAAADEEEKSAKEESSRNEDSDYDPRKEKESSEESEVEEDFHDDDDFTKQPKLRNKQGCTDDGDQRTYLTRMRDLPDESACSDEDVDEDFRVPSSLWNKLYRYQQTCVKWLWELHQFKCGGIIGDEMGLGKTIQTISFLRGLRHSNSKAPGEPYRGLGPVILVAPATVMHQWVKEFHRWFPRQRVGVLHNSGSYSGKKKSTLIEDLHSCKGTLITSYQGIVMYLDDLLRHHWHYIILDEGHKIRNPDAQATLAVKQFRTPHRLILSGSPIQNNLRELWSLFDFVFPGKLATLPVFMAEFAVPITHGGYANATETQVAVGYRCATILRDTIKPYLLRRMKDDVKTSINLPPKNEQVIFCKLTERQRNLYREYVDSHDVKKILDGRLQIFVGLINLRKICNHPDLYDGGPDKEFVTTGQFSGQQQEVRHKDETPTESESTFGFYKRSGKLMVVDALLKLWSKQGQRVLLFTQSRQMLRILEEFVQRRRYPYLSMDGTTTISARQPAIDRFNKDGSIFVFILTTRVGGLGINLTGANRVIIYDPDWNPSTDMQARERAWRIGQEKDVTIYRLMTAGTIEEKIYHRQIFKQFLTNRILKNPKQRRFFKTNELYELFTLSDDVDKKQRTETSDIFAGTGSTVDRKRLKILEKKQKRQEEDAKKQRMRELARKLSQKIGSGEKIEEEDCKFKSQVSVDGVEIEGALRKSRYKDDTEGQEGDTAASNDYILAKLFKNSKVHSVMKHDKIMESAIPDGSLVESEARHVARDAIKKLKEARRLCYGASDGVPNWTGRHGSVQGGNRRKVVFGTKVIRRIPSAEAAVAVHLSGGRKSKERSSSRKENKREKSLFTYTTQKLHAEKALSSTDLIQRIRARNICDPGAEKASDEDDDEEETSSRLSSQRTPGTDDLLADLRTFIAIESDVNGQATSGEIVQRFGERVSKDKATLFKALLKKLCELHKDEQSEGVWKLRPEFR